MSPQETLPPPTQPTSALAGRHFFAGANSSVGFYSLYEHLIAPDANRVLFIKGGPGVGKSTFMRQIGEHFAEQGWPVEYCHCSSDPQSLDGVVFPQQGVALIDGTAPHTQDPRFPGAVDEIINLGEHWQEAELVRAKGAIVSLTQQASRLFAQAYRYLGAARLVLADRETLVTAAMDFSRVSSWRTQVARRWGLVQDASGAEERHPSETAGDLTAPTRSQPKRPTTTAPGHVRQLFATAITPAGLKSFLPNLFGSVQERIILQGEPGTGKSTFVKELAQMCIWAGLDVELFLDAFEPTHPEHLLVPGLNVGVVTANEYHPFAAKGSDWVLDFNQALDYQALAPVTEDLEYDRRRFQELLQRGLHSLARAKRVHDDLEAYYVPHMDFAAVKHHQEQTIARIAVWAQPLTPPNRV